MILFVMPDSKTVDDTHRIPDKRGNGILRREIWADAARLALISAVKAQPDSITAIAERLHRDRSAVERDVDSLHKAGLLAVEQTVLAGHGMMKRVSLGAQKLRLQAELV